MSFTVYKSSAGSGKTYTLVKEYLRLAIPDPSGFRRILAVTFTNKAAAEMKDRIIRRLQEIAESRLKSPSDAVAGLITEIEKETGLTEERIVANAEEVLTRILHDYSDFAVSTIDSFVHRIVKSFAFDLRLPSSFEVEMDETVLLSKIVDLLISKAGSDEKLTKILVSFIQLKTFEEKSWNIEYDLASVAGSLTKEDAQNHIGNIRLLTLDDFEKINDQLRKLIVGFESEVKGIAQKAVDLIKEKGIDRAAFYYGNSGIGNYFENIAGGNFDKLNPNSRVLETINQGKWFGGGCSDIERNSIDEIKEKLTEYFNSIEMIIKHRYGSYIVAVEIKKNVYPLAVLSLIENLLNEYKVENDVLMISEFNRRIAEIVRNESVPFIYERLGEKYSHFLIDEFQDTSVMQWHNLIPLLENSLASGYFNMVVGDGKQAIYRFRNGEVEQFATLPQIYRRPDGEIHLSREKALQRNYKELVLERNFRSEPGIVEFNNDFFTKISSALPDRYKKIYEDVVQQANKTGKKGYVQISFANPEAGEHTFTEFNLTGILETINEVEKAGYEYRDIAILCRSNSNATIVAAELLNLGIDVISSESLLLANSPEVRFLIDLIRLLINPGDKIPMVAIISYLKLAGIYTADLDDLLRKFGLNNVLRTNQTIETDQDNISGTGFFKVLSGNRFQINFANLRNLSVYHLAEELIRIFNLNRKADPYIQFFLDAILKVSRDQKFEISDIPQWWDEEKNKLSIVVPQGTNAVQVMTIHKAKGLEFPVVIYPFAAEKLKKTKDKLWIDFDDPAVPGLKTALVNTSQSLLETAYSSLYQEETDKSMLDMMNLLYVVMTRPTDRLYIFAQRPPKKSDAAVSVPGLLKQYLEMADQWQAEKPVYSFGSRTDKPIQHVKREDNGNNEESYRLEKIVSERWQNRILLSMQAPQTWDVENPDLTKSRGKMLHLILSKIRVQSDVAQVLDQFVGDGVISPEEKELLDLDISGLLAHPLVEPFFRDGLKVKTEAEILDADGHAFRPDRIIIDEKSATVIDFKTGKPEEEHLTQVRKYIRLLEQLAYKQVSGLLFYLSGKEPLVVEVNQ
jgi:ATP-dependent exoDNAse (exonuclease V) beta subunit